MRRGLVPGKSHKLAITGAIPVSVISLLLRKNNMTDKEYLLQAYNAALKSPDPSTQNGAILPYDGGCLEACNTFPEKVISTPERLKRPTKYMFVEHAERNVLYKATKCGVKTEGLTLYAPWAACADCGRAIICCGIKKVVVHKRMMDLTPDHWKESIAAAFKMFEDANVEIVSIEGNLDGPEILFNGSLWKP